MIRALVAFPVMGSLCTRWVMSMKRYLPDDVIITQVLDKYTASNKEPYDVVVTLRCAGGYDPFQNLASPKAVWSEALDNVTLSFITDKDLMVIYDHESVASLREAGYNVVLLSPPIDEELFYVQSCEKNIDVMSVSTVNMDYVSQVDQVLDELGLKHLVMTHLRACDLGIKAEVDRCYVPQDNDRMRYNYNRSKYVMSILAEYEYMPGMWCNGWESGNVEGLFCGARPIILKAHRMGYYNKWLDGFVIEVDRENLKEELRAILVGEYPLVTQEEIARAVDKFSAESTWAIFWQAVREVLQ